MAGEMFKHFLQALYGADVLIHSSLRPAGSIQEVEMYYSGKHDMYGFKSEMSVLSNSLVFGCSDLHTGVVHDTNMFGSNITWHAREILKMDGCSLELKESGEVATEYNNNWPGLLDKAFTEIQSNVRTIITKEIEQMAG